MNAREFDAALAALPDPLRHEVESRWAEFAEHAPDPERGAWAGSLPAVWAASEFVQRVCLTHPEVLIDLVESGDLYKPYAPGEMTERASHWIADTPDEAALMRQLRRWRRRESLRIAWRDLAAWADLDEVLAELSEFADTAIHSALTRLQALGAERDGRPDAAFVVLGMGKLGGCELNFSSDVDLIFAYSEDGELEIPRAQSYHQYFLRLGQRLIQVLSEATEDGYVFRVDMRLRPNGASGPLALSFDAMEHYYQAHGRDWERYALIKARVVAGDRDAGAELLGRLGPFVFRKYLDYGAIEEIRRLKQMIEQELSRAGLERNIKLGPGGIREVEFIGQAFQLIRGGRDTRLRERAIQIVLGSLQDTGDLTPQAVTDLRAAYRFLRRAENRLQMMDDRQVHELPEDNVERLRLTHAMAAADWTAFLNALRRHMAKVHGHFEQVFIAPQGEAPSTETDDMSAVWSGAIEEGAALTALQNAGYSEPARALALVQGLRADAVYSTLSRQGRERLDRLMPLLLGASALTDVPELALARLTKLIEAIGRRSVYLALLVENPMALSQLVKLCAASEWIAQWLSLHPVLLDELIDPVSLYAPLEPQALDAELRRRLAQLPPEDLESQMDILREFHHGHVLRVAAADVGPGLHPEQVGAHLSNIAEAVLRHSLDLASAQMRRQHGRASCRRAGQTAYPGFTVIAYGKLGSRELGYNSDLDMIFLHDPCDGEGVSDGARSLPNEMYFARLGQRMIHLLTTRTRGGILYEVDMRLRPSGRAGALVTHLSAFQSYQESEAWTWEHQALVRARPVAGDATLGAGFEAVRRSILCRARDADALRADVLAMRERTRDAKAARDTTRFDLKQDPGGMIDIEFMVQYWVLRWAHDHPVLAEVRDNIRILQTLRELNLLEAASVETLVGAYRHYLSVEHRLKLMERQALVDPAELGDRPAQVAEVWRTALG